MKGFVLGVFVTLVVLFVRWDWLWGLFFGPHDCQGYPGYYRIGCPHCRERRRGRA